MAKNWYIIQTWTGYEDKIEKELRDKIKFGEISSDVLISIKLPKKDVVEFVKVKNKKTGLEEEKKRTRKEKIYPGYLYLEIDFPEIGWKDVCASIRRVRGVNGFVGVEALEHPKPMRISEVRQVLQQAGDLPGEKSVRIKQNFDVGDQVKINEGAFSGFNGTVQNVDISKNKLEVSVQLFGRATAVSVSASQVEKLVK